MSSIFSKEETASQLAPIIVMPLILFGGQFANPDNISDWISWFQYVSPIRYGLEALVVNEFDQRTYNRTLVLEQVNTGIRRSFPQGYVLPQDNPDQYKTWNVLKYPEINPADGGGFDIGLWKCLVILACITVFLRLLSMVCLKLLVSRFQ
jgi:hypothetical protein